MLIKLLKYPITRHIMAGACIVALLYFFSIAPLQHENKALRNDLKEIAERQHELIADLSKKDTYKIENKVDGAKIKKGGEIRMFPDNKMEMDTSNIIEDSITGIPQKWRKHWWQLWKKRKIKE